MNKTILAGIFGVANLVVLSSSAAILPLPGFTTCQYYTGSNLSGGSIKKTATSRSVKGNFTGTFAGNVGSHSVNMRGDIGRDDQNFSTDAPTFGRSIIYKKANQVSKGSTITVVVNEGDTGKSSKNLGSSEKAQAASYQCFHNTRA